MKKTSYDFLGQFFAIPENKGSILDFILEKEYRNVYLYGDTPMVDTIVNFLQARYIQNFIISDRNCVFWQLTGGTKKCIRTERVQAHLADKEKPVCIVVDEDTPHSIIRQLISMFTLENIYAIQDLVRYSLIKNAVYEPIEQLQGQGIEVRVIAISSTETNALSKRNRFEELLYKLSRKDITPEEKMEVYDLIVKNSYYSDEEIVELKNMPGYYMDDYGELHISDFSSRFVNFSDSQAKQFLPVV